MTSNKNDPIPADNPPNKGPSNKADSIQKTFPKCIIVLDDPIGIEIFMDVPINTSADIIPTKHNVIVLFLVFIIKKSPYVLHIYIEILYYTVKKM